MSGFKLQGADGLKKDLEGLAQRAKELDGTHELKFEEKNGKILSKNIL